MIQEGIYQLLDIYALLLICSLRKRGLFFVRHDYLGLVFLKMLYNVTPKVTMEMAVE